MRRVENSDPDRPRWQGLDLVKIGADNPDNVYHSAPVRGTNTYRITGTRGTIAYTSFGTKANRYAKDGTMASTGELRDDDLVVDPDGSRRDHRLGRTARRHEQLAAPRSRLHDDRAARVVPRPRERDARHLGDRARSARRRRAEPLDRRAPGAVACSARPWACMGTAATFAAWTELFMTRPNELPDWGQEMFQKAGGDPEIFYLHGYWTARARTGLGHRRPRFPTPPTGTSSSNNWWMESMDWEQRITVNKHTAKLDDDGTLTLVVAAEDPGWGNWIDTTGHTSGTALLRWVGTDHHPLPTCRVVDLWRLR